MIDHSKSRRTLATSREEIAALHAFEHWPALRLWPLILVTLVLSAVGGMLPANYWPLMLFISPAIGVLFFISVIAFHDASHDRLHPVHRLNEAFGHLAGTIMFIPLNVYRFAHARHHAYLATQADPELWPFNAPGTPRILRILSAFSEIVFGFIHSPLLFLRAILIDELSPQERKVIVRGYMACIIFWVTYLAIIYNYGLWWQLLVVSIVPMAISGIMQTLNKFTQHMGLHGQTVLGLTRTVIDEHPAGEVVSSAMFYNDYHGTHHRYAKIPYYNLPNATPYTVANAREFCPVYPNLAHAFVAMVPCLADPKVGPQWFDRKVEWDHNEAANARTVPVVEPVFTGEYNT